MVMDRRLCWVLALVVVLAASCMAQALTSAQCDVEPKARINCGYPGITQDACNARECCFNSQISGVIWCFHPNAEDCIL